MLAVGELLLLTFLVLVAPISVFFDGNNVSETSFTEISQEVCLLIAVCSFIYAMRRNVHSRGAYCLIAGFFSCMLIRELDAWFDYIWHGFWVYPATLVAISVIISSVFLWRENIVNTLAEFVEKKSFFYITVGLIIVLVFSRVFGSGGFLWKELMGDAYRHSFKSALQEGLELFGYIFIAYGSFLNFLSEKRADVLRNV